MARLVQLISGMRRRALARLRTRRSVGYFCSYIPPELIEAQGFVPVRLAGLGDGRAENQGEHFAHNESCSFCKECLGLRAMKRPPYGSVKNLIVPSGCDLIKRQGERWDAEFGVKTFHLFVPATWEDVSSQEVYRDELRWLDGELRGLAMKRAKATHLDEIVHRYNEARRRLLRLASLIPYREHFMLAHLFFISPVGDFLKCLDEVEENLPAKPPAPEIRLMVVGSPIGYGDDFLLNALEKFPEAGIVYDATCTGRRFFEVKVVESGDALANLAVAYFNRPPCVWRRPNSQFYEYAKVKMERHNVHGVIYKTLKFCDLWNYEFKRFKDWAKLPVVHIENTYSPAQNAQTAKRISAFIEMIK
jgi:benzoyl-CoA reductase subunit C